MPANNQITRSIEQARLSIGFTVVLAGLITVACSEPSISEPAPCSAPWQQRVEERLQTGDAEGHGPDLGSEEWRSVVEFKLGIRGNAAVPARDSQQWCQYIDAQLRNVGK